jgi:hypothetical protein
MFERFQSSFKIDKSVRGRLATAKTARELVDAVGGTSFASGLYRVHSADSSLQANQFVKAAFPEFGRAFESFGFDWLGRQFAVDLGRGDSSDPEILLFEPGTGEVLEIPVPFSAFHDEELVDYTDAALASSFFKKWLKAGKLAPDFKECVGYRKPLFLGGLDAVDNLEISDIEVYWTLMGQLRLQTRGYPVGTTIDRLDLR